MTAKVVDASAMAAVLFREPEGPGIRASLARGRLVSPDLLRYEVANICWKKCRRNPDQAEALLAALDLLPSFDIELIVVPPKPAAQLALATNLTAYDASYLWLARHLGAELVTLDQLLQRAALAKHP